MAHRPSPSIHFWFLVPLAASGLLLWPCQADAQMTVAGPASPTTHALTVWFGQHVPAKFQAHGRFAVQPLSDAGMEDYLHDADQDSRDGANDDSSDDEIDGVFVDDPPQIVLRVSPSGLIDYRTFAHEYGHYVWFDLLSKDDRRRYTSLYEHQKAVHHLITDYAEESVEEGFAEAFSADINDSAALQRQDALSFQFLSHWTAVPPTP